jgi:predicted DCC family thiol-disulfide oxidoreductase YuxK
LPLLPAFVPLPFRHRPDTCRGRRSCDNLGALTGRIVDPTPKYEILLDGSCAFCEWVRARVQPFDTEARVHFLDYNDPIIAARTPFPRNELDEEMHVRTPEGAWLRGYLAWLAVSCVLPKLAWLGRVGGWPPFSWLGPSAYRFIARHRYTLPGTSPRCNSGACELPHRPAH